ncbi:phenylacetate-CoA oxygenase subunit PaaJ [Gemmatimonadetes bacterium T265]|nr:phenylacetate-CoA oxygenase subunit PaaJ [Gemmatimonadetes bacterium T265]
MTRPSPAELARLLGDGWDPAPAATRAVDGAAADGPGVRVAEPATADAVWAGLDGVPDPEVPVISVVELGIVRDVHVTGDGAVTVTITPTYSGCPAMREIERDVRAALVRRGWADVRIDTVYAPAWTTEWMTDAAREKLRAYGIAPPRAGAAALVALRRATPRDQARPDAVDRAAVPCPRCGSADTRLQSAFGSTACKALHTCTACGEPFEEFKPI